MGEKIGQVSDNMHRRRIGEGLAALACDAERRSAFGARADPYRRLTCTSTERQHAGQPAGAICRGLSALLLLLAARQLVTILLVIDRRPASRRNGRAEPVATSSAGGGRRCRVIQEEFGQLWSKAASHRSHFGSVTDLLGGGDAHERRREQH